MRTRIDWLTGKEYVLENTVHGVEIDKKKTPTLTDIRPVKPAHTPTLIGVQVPS